MSKWKEGEEELPDRQKYLVKLQQSQKRMKMQKEHIRETDFLTWERVLNIIIKYHIYSPSTDFNSWDFRGTIKTSFTIILQGL